MTMRAGYDDDGNFRFVPFHPLEDQCPECRAAPGAPHADGCPAVGDSCTGDVSQSGNFPDSGNITWACLDCGMDRWGRPGIATWHIGHCDVCGADDVPVTEKRDFGVTNCTHSAASADSSTHIPLAEVAARIGIDMASADSAHERVTEPPVEAREVNIPLDVQEQRLRSQWKRSLRIMRDFIDTAIESPDSGLLDLSLRRLRDGYDMYGSNMYAWDWERRRREFLEEIADAACYLTSGPIE